MFGLASKSEVEKLQQTVSVLTDHIRQLRKEIVDSSPKVVTKKKVNRLPVNSTLRVANFKTMRVGQSIKIRHSSKKEAERCRNATVCNSHSYRKTNKNNFRLSSSINGTEMTYTRVS